MSDELINPRWNHEMLMAMVDSPGIRAIGFTGEECGQCKAQINLVGGGHAHFCPRCGGLILTCFSNYRVWWDDPDYGPSRDQLDRAYQARDDYYMQRYGKQWWEVTTGDRLKAMAKDKLTEEMQ